MRKLVACVLPLAVAGFVLLPQRESLPTERLDESELVATISRGQAVLLTDHLEPDKWTLFEYGAEW